MMTFSNSFLKSGFLSPISNATSQLLLQSDRIAFPQFNRIIYENLLFSTIKKEEKSTNNYDINYKINPATSNTSPFLPPIDKKYEYTLVLDLDETLIHYFYTSTGGIFLMRPGCMEFLKELSSKYEIVIFTAATKEYADNILNVFDPNYEIIKHRLYRHHTSVYNQNCVKDLNSIGRNLNKVVMIDNIPENFQNQPHNGFSITTWKDDINDRELFDLMKILQFIYQEKIENVTHVIKTINDFKANHKMTYYNIDLHELIESKMNVC